MMLYIQVFKRVYIPRTLDEVVDFERDIQRAKEGETENVSTDFICVFRISGEKRERNK